MNHDDQLETLMRSGLRERSEDVWGAPLSITDVKGRAGSIRRRRRIGAAVGTAAVLAVVAPLAITLGGALETDDKVDLAPNPPELVRTTLTLDDLERGAAPEVEYFTPDGVVLPGQGLQELAESWQALVPNEAGGGWYGLSPSRDEVADLTDEFEATFSRTVTQSMVSSPDRSSVSWVAVEAGAQTLQLRSTTDPTIGQAWDLPATPVAEPVDFVGERSVLFRTRGSDGEQEIGIGQEDGTVRMFEGDFAGAISASPQTGLVAVQTRSNPDASGCFGMVDPASSTAETVWETCEYSLGAFSPDGRHVLASGAYQSGLGIVSLSVLDAATGDLVASFTPERDAQITLIGVVWESADTILAMANEAMDNTILRFGLDGRLEETVDRAGGDPLEDAPFYLGWDRRRGY